MPQNSSPPVSSTSLRLLHILIPLGRDILIPYLIYYIAYKSGINIQLAFILGAIWSAIMVLLSLIRKRQLDGLALFMLVIMIASLVTSLIAGNPRIMVAKESVISGVLGILSLASLASKRPAFFYLIQKFFSMNPEEWEKRWDQKAEFRRVLRLMSLVWGVGFTVEAIVRIVIAFTLPIQTSIILSPILMYIAIIVLVLWTRIYAKKRRSVD
ncbi:hypothetical protein NDK43_21445 [Neobacillus pocheonensis]|uniref:DUF3159 domain-containing protein n=1 Tax=Neobacillus pocheonensis TaxID=363869 RepID=A0ABT0WFY1_9BACI|nr:hypothetical protein [Neobacillus pocheonensis]